MPEIIPNDDPGQITVCLKQVHEGDAGAEERLFNMVYDQLRRLARQKMSRERPGHILQPTALANETYTRLIRTVRNTPWNDRHHFFSSCATAMRNILVDHARKGRMEQVDIELMPGIALTRQRSEWLMAFDESLSRLATFDPRGAQIVNLTYFVGLSHQEVADLFQISTRTVKRDLESCLRWIRGHMSVHDE